MSSRCGICGEALDRPHVVAIIPIFKSEAHIVAVFEYARNLNVAIPGGIRLCFVIDGTPDNSVEVIRQCRSDFENSVTIVELSRNFGAVSAVQAGLKHVDACGALVFGSDLQEPESLFVAMANTLITAGADVCLGRRLSREDPWQTRLFSSMYWFINRRLLGNDTPPGGFDVFGLSRRARHAMNSLPELNSSLTSQLQWIGFQRSYLPYRRRARLSGESTWNMRKRLKLFGDTLYGFSGAPITMLVALGLLGLVGTGGLAVTTLVASLAGWIEVRGYTTLVLLIGFGYSLNIVILGILGGYLIRAFDNTKRRPQYIVKSVEPNADHITAAQ